MAGGPVLIKNRGRGGFRGGRALWECLRGGGGGPKYFFGGPKCPPRNYQEWFRQTKPKKVRFARSRTNSGLLPGKLANTSALSSIWFAGTPPEIG